MTYADARLDRLELQVRTLESLLRKLTADLAVVAGQARAQGAWPAFQSPSSGGGGGWFGSVPTALTARTGLGPGTGTVSLYQWLAASSTFTYVDTVEVLNLGTDQPAGANVWVEKGADGQFYCSPMEC